MAKSDFICNNCGNVISKGFLRVTSFHKYVCPKHGSVCEDCVQTGFLSKPKCKKCGSVVLRYTWKDGSWKKS